MPTWICYFINTCFLWQFLKPPPTPLPSTPIVVKLWSIIITRSINLFKSSNIRLEPRLLFWIHYQIVKKNFYWLRFKLYFKKKKQKKKQKTKNNKQNKEKKQSFTLSCVAFIPARNIIWPSPNEATRLNLTWDSGWCTSLVITKRNIDCIDRQK